MLVDRRRQVSISGMAEVAKKWSDKLYPDLEKAGGLPQALRRSSAAQAPAIAKSNHIPKRMERAVRIRVRATALVGWVLRPAIELPSSRLDTGA